MMHDGHDDHVRRKCQELGEIGACRPAVSARQLHGSLGNRVDRSDQLVATSEPGGALAPDQPTADDPHPQSGAGGNVAVRPIRRHAYSVEYAPMNSKSNGSSMTPAAAIAWRV